MRIMKGQSPRSCGYKLIMMVLTIAMGCYNHLKLNVFMTHFGTRLTTQG
jgi:hypothetical protein